MAPLTYAPKLHTFALDNTNGIRITRFSDTQLHRAEYRTRQAGDGAVLGRRQDSGRRIKLGGIVYGSDDGDRRTKQDAFAAKLTEAVQRLQIWSDRSVLVSVEKEIAWGDVRGGRFHVIPWSVTFRSALAGWEGAEISDPIAVTTSPKQHTLASESPAGNRSARPQLNIVNNSTTTTVSGLSMTIASIATGKILALRGLELAPLQNMLIRNEDGVMGDGTSQPPRLTQVEGDWLSLAAGGGDLVEIVHNGGTLDFAVNFLWRPVYLGI